MCGEIGKCTVGWVNSASLARFNGPKMSLPLKKSVIERGFDRNMVESPSVVIHPARGNSCLQKIWKHSKENKRVGLHFYS